jgi:predicted phosphohydrolase
MRIFAISDLHLSLSVNKPMDIFGPHWEGHFEVISEDWKARVTDDDVVLLAGDHSWAMKLEEAGKDLEAIGALPGKKVIIRGNHDYWWSSYSKVKSILPENFIALQNDSVRINDLLICGSRGWTIPDEKSAPEDVKIYARELIRIKMSLDDMARKRKPGDKVIAMLHYPPFGYNYANTELTDMLKAFNVDAVVFGHLHYPNTRLKLVTELDNITYCLTSCDLLGNKLAELEFVE